MRGRYRGGVRRLKTGGEAKGWCGHRGEEVEDWGGRQRGGVVTGVRRLKTGGGGKGVQR